MNAMTDSQTGATREPNPALIFDGGAQQESHVFLNGIPVSWYIEAVSRNCTGSEVQLRNLVTKIGTTKFTVYLVDLRSP
jgi:hypothetical protein